MKSTNLLKDIRVSLSKDVCNANIFYMHKHMSPHVVIKYLSSIIL